MGSRPSRVIFILFFLLVGGWTVIYRPPQLKEGPEKTDIAAFDRRATFTDSWLRFNSNRVDEKRVDKLSRDDPTFALEKYDKIAEYYRNFASAQEGFLEHVFVRSLSRVEKKMENLSTD